MSQFSDDPVSVIVDVIAIVVYFFTFSTSLKPLHRFALVWMFLG